MRVGFDLVTWLEADAAADLRARMHRRAYAPGESVYTQGEPGHAMFRVARGFVQLSVQHPDGRQAIFLLFGPGDVFGASSLVDDEPRPHTAEALTPLELDVLCRPAFQALRSAHPSFDLALMRLLARQMRVASTYLVVTHLSSLTARVAKRVMELAAMTSESEAAASTFPLNVRQAELADMVGASRQSVNKVLQKLQEDGLLVLEPRRISVRDMIGLARIAGT